MGTDSTAAEPALGFLAHIARIREASREFPPLLWSFLYFFLLLSGYYLLRPVREAMGASSDVRTVFPEGMITFFAQRGLPLNEFTLQVLFSMTFLLVLALQPAYGAVVSRFPRRVFLPAVYGFFIATLLVFYALFESGMPGRGMAFFLWLTVFNLYAVAVFWSFMADVWEDVQARKVYGYIGAAGTIGAITGPLLTRLLVDRIGIANLMLVSAVLLSLCIVCILKLRHWAVLREQTRQLADGEKPMGGDVWGGLILVTKVPLLRWMALLVLAAMGIGTLLYNEQAAAVRALYPDAKDATEFFASVDLAVNLLTLTVQLFVTRFLLSRYGIAPALIIPGMAIIIGFSVLAASPYPMLLTVVQVVTRASEFSLAKPARETIYTRVPREWRYKAGAAIDTVIYRGGDLSFVWLHKFMSAWGSQAVFAIGAALAGGLTLAAVQLWRIQKRLPDLRTLEKKAEESPMARAAV